MRERAFNRSSVVRFATSPLLEGLGSFWDALVVVWVELEVDILSREGGGKSGGKLEEVEMKEPFPPPRTPEAFYTKERMLPNYGLSGQDYLSARWESD